MCFGLRMKEAGKEKLQYFKSQRDARGKNQLSSQKLRSGNLFIPKTLIVA
jgi:hypothetical protein